MNKRRMALSVFWIVIGVILFALSLMEIIDQSVWADRSILWFQEACA